MAAYLRACFDRLHSFRWESTFSDLFRPSLRIDRRCLFSTESSVTPTETAQSSTNEEIVIPKRIQRGPTDILKALAATVSTDYTAAHYKYHDDPFFIPTHSLGKRTYALSKESGKKAAQWIFKTYPKYFEHNPAEPSINVFMPKEAYNENSEISEETLRQSIALREVTNAFTIYQLLMKKGIAVSNDVKLELLELLCFYNSEDPIHEDNQEVKWFRQDLSRFKKKTWKDGGLAEQLFNTMEPKDVRAYLALIRGMCKNFQGDKAYVLYQEMVDKNMPIDVTTYNYLISLSPYLKETGDGQWEMCLQFLVKMQKSGIIPNLQTFNNVLLVLSKRPFPKAKNHALETLGEMKFLGIEPSLATYYHLLNVFCKERGPTSTILYDIMDHLEKKEYEIRDSYDVSFFVTAMGVCLTHLLDRDVALKIHDLLNTGRNYKLIGAAVKETLYYDHFFKILCNTESVDAFFEYYNKLVPNLYTPEANTILEILEMIEVHCEWKYIAHIWTEINSLNLVSRQNILEKVAEILGKYKPDDKLIQEQFVAIAWNIKEHLNKQKEDKLRSILLWTGSLLSNSIQALLNARDFDKAWEIFEQTEKEQSKISGVVTSEVLSNLVDACIENKNAQRALLTVTYAFKNEILETSKFAKKVLDAMSLTELQRIRLNDYLRDEQFQPENNNNEKN